MARLVFTAPDKDTPGFLKRARDVFKFQREIKTGDATEKTFDDLVEFLAQFVTEPEDPKEKRDALWQASYDQFLEMLESVAGTEQTDPLAESG